MSDTLTIILFSIYFGIILLSVIATQIYQGYLKEIGRDQISHNEWDDILCATIFWPIYIFIAIIALPFWGTSALLKYIGKLIAIRFKKK